MERPSRFLAPALAALLLCGCAELLPRAQNQLASPWGSYGDAQAAIERIDQGKTTGAKLRADGLDPYTSPNVQLLTYSDITLRFPVNIGRERLDAGLRECLEAGKACIGYAITARDVKRERTGNFWLDVLGFERKAEITGWTFNALVLLVDDRVVYTLHGGQPVMHEQEVNRQPLGPIQSFGESLPLSSLVK